MWRRSPMPGPGAELARQVLDADRRLPAAEDERPLEHVAHLPHVARPAVGEQPVQHLARQRRRAVGQLGAEIGEQPGNESEAVLARAVAHRGQLQRHDAQAVVEILPEPALLDLALEVLVGRGDQADVHGDLAGAAEPAEGLGLEHLQQLGLELGARSPISSRKMVPWSAISNRPACGPWRR